MRHLLFSRRFCLSVLVLPLSLSLFSCGSSPNDSARPSTPSMAAQESATSTVAAVGTMISQLIPAPNTSSFDVTFKWLRGVPGAGTGMFVWRQRQGLRRWDDLPEDVRPAYIGNFMIERGFQGNDETFPGEIISCEWFRKQGEKDPRVSCVREPALGVENALDLLLFSVVIQVLPRRSIAGHDAQCYSAQNGRSEDTICVDASSHVPLLFDGLTGSGDQEYIEAVEVAEDAPNLSMPENLPFDVQQTGQSPERPLESLQLPRAFD